MKILRFVFVMTMISLLVVLALSFSVFGENESRAATGEITPVDGVYEVTSKNELIWLFGAMEDGTVSASASIKLMKDIDVSKGLNTLTVTFEGHFDGNGKTISNLSRAMFTQCNGTVSNLTLRGSVNNSYSDNETARKTASVAHNASNASFYNVVSYMTLKSSASDLNAGGLVGFISGTVVFDGCAYNGEYTMTWKGSGGGLGGLAGWVNPNGSTVLIKNCSFGGKIKLSGSSTGNVNVGGLVGLCTNASLIINNCTSNGTISSTTANATDRVGGIIGIGQRVDTVIENCSNKSDVTAVHSAGGIVGGITVNTTINSCTNFGTITAANAGEFSGGGEGVKLTAVNSVSFTNSTNDLCATTYISENCYRASDLSLVNTFTIEETEYERYNLCVIEKESGILKPMLATDEMFEAHLSMREDGSKHSMRFLLLTNNSCTAESVVVTITFKNDNGETVKSYQGTLADNGGDLTLYASVIADGETYFAAQGTSIFGCIVKDIPEGAWEMVDLVITDTADGKEYLAPVSYEISSIMTIASLPNFSSLGSASSLYNAGPGLMSDRNGTTDEDTYMTVIKSTTAEKLAAYVATLPDYGYRLVSQNTLDGDTYYTYTKSGAMLYLYHSSKVKETRIIVDNSSTLLSKINYEYTKKAGDTTEFYQYSINYGNNDVEGYDPITYTETAKLDCGMLYIVKLPDNKVVIVDGGHGAQVTAKARAGIMKFLRQITGKGENEKVDIAMWYFTHAHGDHVAAASDIIAEYHSQINLELVAFNFPSYQVLADGYDDNTFSLKQNINRYFPNVAYHKFHTGEVISLAGVTFEVVYTHEDAVSNSGKTEISDFNSSSTVTRITFDGKTVMMLGDVSAGNWLGSGNAEPAMKNLHSSDYYKSDMVQAAHHGYNGLSTIYGYINADIALFPNSMYGAMNNKTPYNQITKYSSFEYYAHKYTYKFVVENGEIVVTALPRYDQQ